MRSVVISLLSVILLIGCGGDDEAAKYSEPQYPLLSHSLSIGTVQIRPGESPGAALQRVEAALSEAILAGGDRVCTHQGEPFANDPIATGQDS
jgi:hypothetical protein